MTALHPSPTAISTTAPTIPHWVVAIVLFGALLTAAGGVIALVRPEMLLAPGERMTAAANVYAGYLVSRDLALAGALLAALALRARPTLAGFMWLAALTQGIDTVVDATTGRTWLVPVVFVVGVAFLIGALRLKATAPSNR
jgi:hypothetical protein